MPTHINMIANIFEILSGKLSKVWLLLIVVLSGCTSDKTKLPDLIHIPNYQIVQDPTLSLSFEDVLAGRDSLFHKEEARYRVNSGSVWMLLDPKSHLKNDPHRYSLSVTGQATYIEFHFYRPEEGWVKYTDGTKLPLSERSTDAMHPSFPLEGVNLQYPVFLKLDGMVSPMIIFELTEKIKFRHQRYLLLTAVIVGALMFIILINIYRAINSSETIYFLYAIYVLSFLVDIVAFGGNNLIYYFTDISPHNKYSIHLTSIFFLNLSGALYGIEFLKLRQNNRKFYNLLMGFVIACFFAFGSLLFNARYVAQIGNGSASLLVSILFFASWSSWRKGLKYVSYYVVSYFIFALILIGFSTMRTTSPETIYIAPIPIFFLGFLLEVLLLNLSLNQRHDFEKKQAEREREQTQKRLLAFQSKQNQVLEEKVTKRTEALQKAQDQLIQSEKMAALGVLTAGIAHEINNPINFVYAGINSLKDNLKDIRKVLDAYSELNPKNISNQLDEIEGIKSEVEFDKLMNYVDRSASSVIKGAERTSEIVQGLKSFSRSDSDILAPTDIHDCIENTLLLLNNQYKDRIEIIKKYDDIPAISSNPGKINQVFMNVIGNAIQAMPERGIITINTGLQVKKNKQGIEVAISDTGRGMNPEITQRIFEPFFTTKDIGEGTGLGLSITHGIVEEQGGSIEVDSDPGHGTTFRIWLPLSPDKVEISRVPKDS